MKAAAAHVTPCLTPGRSRAARCGLAAARPVAGSRRAGAASGGATRASLRLEGPGGKDFGGAPHLTFDGNRLVAQSLGKQHAK
jgi:hypothetical protein